MSEAIRLGSMMAPQGFDMFMDGEGHTCALGAAGAAVGVDFQGTMLHPSKVWPALLEAVPCPTGDGYHYALVLVISHLNDLHRWTREQIADWVETVESPQVPPTIERTPDEEYAWV